MDSTPIRPIVLHQAYNAMIMSNNFKLSDFPSMLNNISSFVVGSPQLSPCQSPTKPRKGQSVCENRDLAQWIIEIVTQICQFTISEFTISIKKERVPIQKNILKKTNQYIEKLCLQLPIPEETMKRLYQKISEDQALLLFALSHVSKPLIDFLENHFTDLSEELQISIQEVNLHLFQPKLIELIKNYIRQSMNITQDSLYHNILDQSQYLIEQLAHELSDQTCLILEEGRSYIENLIIKFKEKTIPNVFQNKYIILSLFLELSRKCYQTIQDLLDFTIFHYAEPDVVEKFMKFTIENHDTLILKNKIAATPIHKSKKSISQVLDVLNAHILNKNKPLSVYRIQNRFDPNYQSSLTSDKSTEVEDDFDEYSPTKQIASQLNDTKSFSTGTYSLQPKPIKIIKNNQPSKLHLQGLYIEGEDAQTKFIIYFYKSQFVLIYAPLISKRWTFQKTFVIDPSDKEGFFKKDSNRKSGWGVHPTKFKNLDSFFSSTWIVDQLAEMITWQNLTVDERYQRIKNKKAEGEMDTMFGFFLAHLTRTNRLQLYLQQFGENAVNNGCLPQLIAYVPIIRDFLNLGGFGQQALIISQEIFLPTRTFTPVSTLAISTSLLSGMVIGQVLIPLPVVGGLVGGIIGGYLGNKGISSYTKSKNQKKATDLVNNICKIQKTNGSWECQKVVLDMLQLNFKILEESIPKIMREDAEKSLKWLNLTIFAYLSLYYHQNQPGVWVECLEQSQRFISIEKIPCLESLDNLKHIIEIIVKNL